MQNQNKNTLILVQRNEMKNKNVENYERVNADKLIKTNSHAFIRGMENGAWCVAHEPFDKRKMNIK